MLEKHLILTLTIIARITEKLLLMDQQELSEILLWLSFYSTMNISQSSNLAIQSRVNFNFKVLMEVIMQPGVIYLDASQWSSTANSHRYLINI